MDSAVSSAILGSDCVGRVVDGRFTLLRRLGGTEQSSVFLTELVGDPVQQAAIKLTPAYSVDAKARIAQWATASTLSHPHLMRLLYAGRCEFGREDLLYVVTEYAEEVLSEILPQRPLTPVETRDMLGSVVDALAYLHGQGFMHGHLKPSNIMVVGDQLKLSVDRLHAADDPGRASPSLGSYDGPEAAAGKMSPAADVWSLGVVLVEALTQKPAVWDPIWDRMRGRDPVLPASLPQPFSALARECLQVDPARRPTLNGIRAYLEPAQPQPARSKPARPAPARPAEPAGSSAATAPSRTSVMIVAGAVLVVGVTIAAVIIGSHHGRPSVLVVPQSSAPPPAATQPLKASVVKGAVAYQAVPHVPQHISDDIQGRIRVGIRVQVDPDGKVSDATIDLQGPSRYFANQALQAARDWKFRPARVDGRAVASTWTLQFRFGQTGTTITPTETSP